MAKYVSFLIIAIMVFSVVGTAEQPLPESVDPLYVYVYPLRRADAMLLIKGDQSMLIDTGEAEHYDIVSQLLNQLGIKRIDYVVNTHPHHDHLGGLPQLAKNYEIGEFITCFQEDFTGKGVVQHEAISALKESNMPISYVDDGDKLFLGDVVLTVMRQTEASSVNAHSMMLMVEYGQCRMLLTADVTVAAQNIFIRDGYDLKADVLKFPHHGRERMSPKFLKAVDPEYVFITNNKSDSEAARKQLGLYKIKQFITRNGLICFKCDGVNWEVSQ